MREIKFRAWDKRDALMRMLFLISSRGVPLEVGFEEPQVRETDEFVIMQYTGLKDKNGREIYEGDIIKAPDIFTGDQDANYSIKWNDSYARFMTWHESIGCCQFLYAFEGNIMPIGIDKHKDELDTRNTEIIGNIYENPELVTL